MRLRGSERLDALQSLNDTHEDQFLPGQRRNVTYVSRLQGVQAAVDHQLEEMTKDAPNRRVALITFSNDVSTLPFIYEMKRKRLNKDHQRQSKALCNQRRKSGTWKSCEQVNTHIVCHFLQVLMVGDGSADPVTVAGDKLNDQEKLKQIGAEFALPKTVKETRKALGDKLFE